MDVQSGKNYHFLIDDEQGALFVHAPADSFYSVNDLPAMPSIIAEDTVIPAFHYRFAPAGRREQDARAAWLPAWTEKTAGRISRRDENFADGLLEVTLDGSWPVDSNPYTLHAPGGYSLLKDGEYTVQLGCFKNVPFGLYERRRKKVVEGRYISVRDMVDPTLDAEAVYKKIEQLALTSRQKHGLFKLLKILYAGKPADELDLVKKIFAEHPALADNIYSALFNIEILPLIHGPFIQDILAAADDLQIRGMLDELSQPLHRYVKENMSRRRFTEVVSLKLPRADEKRKPAAEAVTLQQLFLQRIGEKFTRTVLYPGEGRQSLYLPVPTAEQADTPAADESARTAQPEVPSGYELISVEARPFLELNQTARPLVLKNYGRDADRLYFQVLRPVSVLRFDFYHNNHQFGHEIFVELRKDTIVSIELFEPGRAVFFGGVLKRRLGFEGALSWRGV